MESGFLRVVQSAGVGEPNGARERSEASELVGK